MTKKNVSIVVLAVCLISAVAYIVYDIWGDFKGAEMNQAYQQGKLDTINALIEQSKQCGAIPVSNGTITISVVNVDCLQQAQTPAETEQ